MHERARPSPHSLPFRVIVSPPQAMDDDRNGEIELAEFVAFTELASAQRHARLVAVGGTKTPPAGSCKTGMWIVHSGGLGRCHGCGWVGLGWVGLGR